MTWFFVVLIVLALGGVAMVAAGFGAPLAPAYDDRPDTLVPPRGPLRGDDLRRVRFPVVLRGYRMSDVDALLERMAAQCDTEVDAEVDANPHQTPHDGENLSG